MTLREFILCASPLSTGATVREHMAASTCEGLAGGITYISEGQYIIETEADILLEENTEVSMVSEQLEVLISESDNTLISTNEGKIDGIC